MSRKKFDEELHEMPKVCAFCEFSCTLYTEDKMLCKKHGIVTASYKCRKFRYDPLKRVPNTPIMTPFEESQL